MKSTAHTGHSCSSVGMLTTSSFLSIIWFGELNTRFPFFTNQCSWRSLKAPLRNLGPVSFCFGTMQAKCPKVCGQTSSFDNGFQLRRERIWLVGTSAWPSAPSKSLLIASGSRLKDGTCLQISIIVIDTRLVWVPAGFSCRAYQCNVGLLALYGVA